MLNIDEISQADYMKHKKEEQQKANELKAIYKPKKNMATQEQQRHDIETWLIMRGSLTINQKTGTRTLNPRISDLYEIIDRDPALKDLRPHINEISGYKEHESGERWTDADTIKVQQAIEDAYKIALGHKKGIIQDAIDGYADAHKVNPLKDYMRQALDAYKQGLRGKYTIEDYWIKTLGAEDNVFNRIVTKYYMIGTARMAICPGSHIRNIPVLAGGQNIGKSTSLLLLAPYEGLYIGDKIDLSKGKDLDAVMAKTLIYEVSEGEVFKSYSAETMKSYFTKYQYDFRPPYGREIITRKRLACYVITSNNGGGNLLSDPSGNSRYSIIDCATTPDDIDPAYDVRHVTRDDITALWGQAMAELEAHPEYYQPYGLDYPESIQQMQRKMNDARNFKAPTWDIYDDWMTANHGKKRVSARQLHTQATAKSWTEYTKKDRFDAISYLDNRKDDNGKNCFRLHGTRALVKDLKGDGKAGQASDAYDLTPAGRAYFEKLNNANLVISMTEKTKRGQPNTLEELNFMATQPLYQ